MDASGANRARAWSAPAEDVDLLRVLQRCGPMTVEALAVATSLSRTAVLRRLAVFGSDGLVERRAVRRGVGRPRYQYDVTMDAQGRLDTEYGALVGSIFDAVIEVGGHELISRVFDARRRRTTAVIRERLAQRGLESAPLAERTRELATWQEEHGFVADVTGGRDLRLRQHNCPILRIACAAPAACDAELRMIADVLEADVERESLIATGARRCVYRVTARTKDFPGPAWRGTQMRADGRDAAPRTIDEPLPAWRREHMVSALARQRATRWPPGEGSTRVVRRSDPG